MYQALEINHEVIPILNKIDLPASDIERQKKKSKMLLVLKQQCDFLFRQNWRGIDDILEAIINKLPAPKGY